VSLLGERRKTLSRTFTRHRNPPALFLSRHPRATSSVAVAAAAASRLAPFRKAQA
jgi:hypothetical protein